MSLDFSTLSALRTHHPAWRLLCSDHAPLIASFLHRIFVAPNVRVVSAADLAEMLEDELFALRERLGENEFPKRAQEYLNDWASPDKAWLRKFYQQGSDEAQFDLTAATEKAINWLSSLTERSFVGTESRLLTLFDLLKQMSEGSEVDPAKRIAELQKKREDIDAEISRVLSGDLGMLDDTGIKDRFQQFMQISRDLLTDFREVEYNFRQLDRRVREHIALWEGSKGALLEQIMGERDAISDSDQGKSFRAFWDFLMSSRRQEELTQLLDHVLALTPVQELGPGPRTRRVHYDWLEAGEHTQRTVAQLSQQLRRFLDDQTWLENRRIMDILRGIESRSLALRQQQPSGEFFSIDEMTAEIELPMERPLHTPSFKPVIADLILQAGDADLDTNALYNYFTIDKAELMLHIRHALQLQSQATLQEITTKHPLKHGLAELVSYLHLGNESFNTVIDEEHTETIGWHTITSRGEQVQKQATLPRVIFVR